jgi:hypothetical protein
MTVLIRMEEAKLTTTRFKVLASLRMATVTINLYAPEIIGIASMIRETVATIYKKKV